LLRAERNLDLNLALLAPEETAGIPTAAFAEGHGPTAGIQPDLNNRLFEPLEDAAVAKSLRTGGVKASGTAGAFYTSARLVPESADQSYPYRTVGKLFFTKPGQGDFYCSAAVLRLRVVLTAGQCIHSGKANPGFYTNFRFVPAYRNGAAPFGTWNWAYVAVSTTWSQGGGTVPNAADYGMIEVEDRNIGGVLRKLGDVVGFLGYQIQKLRPNHAHLLAYASNFDGGEKMHQVTAQAFRAAAQNNVEYGSDMRGGSVGGPLIQDFGDNAALVRAIGVLSYFNNSAAIKVEGASIPDSRFTSVLNNVCTHRAGNC
jgi:V8-like Glu-specific endopeptidase